MSHPKPILGRDPAEVRLCCVACGWRGTAGEAREGPTSPTRPVVRCVCPRCGGGVREG